MLTSQKIQVRQSERRERMLELAGADEISDDDSAELRKLESEAKGAEVQLRAALTAESAAADEAVKEGEAAGSDKVATTEADKELRALRERVTVAGFMAAAIAGREVRGAEAEYLAAVDVPPGPHVPLSLFEPTPEQRAAAAEHRVATTAPGTVSVNLAPIFPSIFARAVLPRCGVSMPMVASGTAAVATVTTDLSAAAVAAGAAQPATAAVFAVDSTTPHRVSATLEIRLEDIAAVGTASFEGVLRQNLMLALSAQLDNLGLNGAGSGAEPQGLLPQLTNPSDPTAVVTWAGFIEAVADGIDGGPWAESMNDVMLLVNAETMRLAEKTFQAGTGTDTPGEMSAAAYLRAHSRGFMASARMPAKASNIAQALRVRNSTAGLDGVNAVELARCPVWNYVAIDDIYTLSTAGTRRFSIHALIGDVMIVQPDAFARVDLKVS